MKTEALPLPSHPELLSLTGALPVNLRKALKRIPVLSMVAGYKDMNHIDTWG